MRAFVKLFEDLSPKEFYQAYSDALGVRVTPIKTSHATNKVSLEFSLQGQKYIVNHVIGGSDWMVSVRRGNSQDAFACNKREVNWRLEVVEPIHTIEDAIEFVRKAIGARAEAAR